MRAAPGPAELLRFRERLERAARDLTHEYDELLGRLSYAAMPTTTGPTISFARGAPSLDIVDVDGLKEAAVRAFEKRPRGRPPAYGTAVGYPPLREWIADKHGVEPERVLVTNGSLQADAFLFDAPRPCRATRWSSRARPTTARCWACASAARSCTRSRSRRTGSTRDALARAARGRRQARSSPTSSRTSRTRPATRSRSSKRQALLALAPEHDFIDLRGRPVRRAPLHAASRCRRCSSLDEPSHVVYASSFTKTVCPGVRVGYLVGPPS